IVLELKRDAVEDVVLNQLYHHTQMEQTFGVINLALVGGEPKVLTLKEVLQSHVDHRIMMVRRRTEFDLRKARERLHIVEGLIPEEHVVVPITNTGYIKRVPSQMYHTQRRGGKGVTGMETKEEDFVVNLFTASTHDYILFFSSKGQCYWLKTYRLPVGSRYAK